jgi:hypothetical protein
MFDNMTLTEAIKMFAPIIAIQLVLMIFCIYRLTRDKVKYLPKWVWAIIIVLVNFIGPVFYLIIGRERD